MKIAIFGSGYVGLVTGAVFSDFGNDVTLVDVNADKIAALERGESPIYEPGLAQMLQRNRKAGRLHFTTEAQKGLSAAEVVFVAVGTPEGQDGQADLSFVESVARTVGEYAIKTQTRLTFVLKSTVPVGTADRCRKLLPANVAVANNPEFLKEGAALGDFLRPDRVVIGAESREIFEQLAELYSSFVRGGAPILFMSNRSAEVAKYAANSFLAMKVSFINDLAVFCENAGADIYDVRGALIHDVRIGNKFLYPGAGYGGSCFPKDVQAFAATARDLGHGLALIEATHQINQRQRRLVPERVRAFFTAHGKNEGTVALWGVSFKPDTDDIREAPALILIDELSAAGFKVRAYDPQANHSLARQRAALIKSGALILCESALEALQGADVLAVMTEWNEFRSPDYKRMAEALKLRAVFDGKNIYREKTLRSHGLNHFGIGLKPFQSKT